MRSRTTSQKKNGVPIRLVNTPSFISVPTCIHRVATSASKSSSAPDNAAATGGAYTVELARSKRTITVNAGQSLIEALKGAGFKIKTSCEQGICGTCETRVLAGTPDHRDMILSDDEKAANDTMMVCCSGSLGPTLVLDL